jgi:hypothetical protein
MIYPQTQIVAARPFAVASHIFTSESSHVSIACIADASYRRLSRPTRINAGKPDCEHDIRDVGLAGSNPVLGLACIH